MLILAIVITVAALLSEKYVSRKFPQIARRFQLCFSFLFAVVLYTFFTWNEKNMIFLSTDAADIWQTITSFHTEDVYGSYVLYKGINSVYPYVWFYDLARFFNVEEFFFVKAFFCGAFAYVSAIGFPNMIELLTKRQTRMYRRCLLAIAMWYFGYYSRMYTQLMVDLPCLLYFVLMINAALKLYRGKKSVFRYIWAGLMGGLCMSGSGQYTMPALCIALFILAATCRADQNSFLRKLFLYFCPFVISCMLVVGSNHYFEQAVVDPLREEGAWIPSGDDWLRAGLVRFNRTYRTDGSSANASIMSYRNTAILRDYYDQDLSGITELTVAEYLQIFFRYPVDFILNYLNSFFLVLSPDHGNFYAVPLLLFYSLLYCSLYIGFLKCKTWKNFFSPLFLIGFAFLWATVPMLVMNIEQRTCMQIQCLIAALAICDDTIWMNGYNVIKSVKENGLVKSVKRIKTISYPVVFYLLFLCACMMHIATLYETLGDDVQKILIKFS